MDIVTSQGSRPWLATWAEIEFLGNLISETEYRQLAGTFADPSQTWFFDGQGRSGCVAAMVAMRCMHIGRTTHLVGDSTTPAIVRGDGLLVISASGRTPTCLLHAQTAKEVGAQVALVTREPASPLAEIADVRIVLPAGSSGQLGGNLFEQGALLVLDSLVNELSEKTGDARGLLRARHANLQ